MRTQQQYTLDARTATAHFPGIGRYVRNLAAALPPLLVDDERLVILWNPSDPTAWNPSALASLQVQIVPAPVSSFSLGQQWKLPRLLRQISQSPIPSPQSPIFHSTYYLMPHRPGIPTLLTVYDLIALLQWFLRDIWLQSLNAGQSLLQFPDLTTATQEIAARIPKPAALKNLSIADQLQRQLNTNVQEALAIEVALLKIAL